MPQRALPDSADAFPRFRLAHRRRVQVGRLPDASERRLIPPHPSPEVMRGSHAARQSWPEGDCCLSLAALAARLGHHRHRNPARGSSPRSASTPRRLSWPKSTRCSLPRWCSSYARAARRWGWSVVALPTLALQSPPCGGAYLVTAALQSVGGPWPWSSAVAILKAMGSDDGRLATAGPAMAAIITLRATLLAAVGEEMLFRGVLYTWLRQRFPAAAAIPVSAAAHAAIHGFPAILPLAFVMGLGFGWVRERSGSIVPTIVVHALHNVALIGWAYYVSGWTARLPAWGGS